MALTAHSRQMFRVPRRIVGMRERGDILLVACYELGHQPLAVAWPAAALERAGDPARPEPRRAPGARALRAPRARRRARAGGIRRGEPWLQASLPALPDPPGVRRPLLRRRA